MEVLADLHFHSKYSRAVSQRMVIPEIAKWAKRKGIDLVATADWTHPLWLRELKENLEESGEGVYHYKNEPKDVFFLLSTEISSIYTQNNQPHRIHNLVLAPSFSVIEEINNKLRLRGVNLLSDGRPITGLSSIEICELVFSVSEDCLVIPAHCLLPTEVIHINNGIKRIDEIKEGDRVYTHRNCLNKVEKVFIRPFKGEIYKIVPDYFRIGTWVTGEHPFWAIKTKKNCRSISRTLGICKPLCSQKEKCARRYFERYKPGWTQAKELEKGDVLVFPRFTDTEDKRFFLLSEIYKDFDLRKRKVSIPGRRTIKIPNKIPVNELFCRLAGYFLAEGYLGKDDVSFCFHSKEDSWMRDIQRMMGELFGVTKARMYQRKGQRGVELIFHSKVLNLVFRRLFFERGKGRRAHQKCLPSWMLTLNPYKQKEILRGWWRGDKGYTTSRLLMNQMKLICLRLGIIPSIGVDTKENHQRRGKHDKFENRTIIANYDTYHFSNLSFFKDPFSLLGEPMFSKFKTKIKRRRGWMDDQYAYLPIRKIEKRNYKGEVYNLEVRNDNSYTAEFACVHNCWTPWYSLYGSRSGFDSLKECFGEFANKIYAIETGLSSDPAMNWRIQELDKRSIISFSDAHSPQKLGREVTAFEIKDIPASRDSFGIKKLKYEDIKKAIQEQKVAYTIEFYPEEGKYHYTGHRNCGVKHAPEETKKLGTTCPVCGRQLTVGVMHRVEELANRPADYRPKNRPPYKMLVPLVEILAESLGSGVSSQIVETEYNRLVNEFNSEFNVLLKVKIEEIARVAGEKVAEGIRRVRGGKIFVDPGYDGVFGTVKIWGEKEKEPEKQMTLF